MKLFENVRGIIERFNSKGRGILTKNGKTIAINFTVSGDEVTVTLTGRGGGELRGALTELHSPAPARVVPRCPYVGKCGGCAWQMIDYPAQLEYKRGLVNQTFQDVNLPLVIEKIEPSPEIFYYRNRMDYVFGANGQLGLKVPSEWWNVLDLRTCFLLSPESVEIMERLRNWMRKHHLQPWDSRAYRGLLRYLVIREGKNTGERMITLVTSAEPFPETARADFVELLKDNVTSLYWGVNPTITDLSLANELHLLHGKPALTERINGYSYSIHPNSFFQTNSGMAARLMEVVREFAGLTGTEDLLDLYCGVGFFGIALARDAKNMLGIESDHFAIDLAKENAAANGVTNATFLTGTAEMLLPKLPRQDVVIIDPPRSGLHPKVLKTLIENKPGRIVYVSCNYPALARELPTFLEHYTITASAALDLFPHTPHVEIITRLDRKA